MGVVQPESRDVSKEIEEVECVFSESLQYDFSSIWGVMEKVRQK